MLILSVLNLHKLGLKSLFSDKIGKTPPKIVVRDVRGIKELDSIERNSNWKISYPGGLSPGLGG